MEIKKAGRLFDQIENKEGDGYVEYKGIKCRVVKGYLATWDRDRGNDKFHKGAFTDSLKEWRKEGRDPKVKEMHGKTIGVYPIDTLKEDSVGLYGEAYINMEIGQGVDAFSKAQMGIYDRKSIGFSADPESTKGEFPYGREIYKAHLYEGSLVDEPMNIAAKITEVKKDMKMINELLGSEDDIKEMTIRDVERTLKELGASDLQAKVLIAQIKSFVPDEPVEEKNDPEFVTPTAEDYETLIQVLQDALK